MLSVYLPGDALDYILIREEKTSITSTNYEHQKTLLAQRLGYDKPLFYFSVISLAEYGWQQYLPSEKQQKSYNHLLRNFGCGSEVFIFYKKINAARTAITTSFASATDTAIRQTASNAANSLFQIETQVKLSKNDSILDSFNNYATILKLNSLANSILHSYNAMQTKKSSWKKWVPAVQLNAQNRFHDWFFGTDKNSGIIHLNLGQSLYTGRSIGSLLKEKIFWSLLLTVLAIIIATISGFNSPRYFIPVSNSKAYVSDLYDNRLTIVNLSTNTISGYIPAVAGTEQMKMVYGKVFVSSLFTDKVYVINAMTDMLTDSITLAYSPNSICEDKNGILWVLCSGDSLKQKPSALIQMNPLNNQVIKSFVFTGNHAPWRMCMNQQNDTLYFLDRHVWQMSISDTTLPSTPFINGNGKLFYTLSVDASNGEIYVSDAIDYLQRGSIYRYSASGNLIDQFKAGIIPGGFCFR